MHVLVCVSAHLKAKLISHSYLYCALRSCSLVHNSRGLLCSLLATEPTRQASTHRHTDTHGHRNHSIGLPELSNQYPHYFREWVGELLNEPAQGKTYQVTFFYQNHFLDSRNWPNRHLVGFPVSRLNSLYGVFSPKSCRMSIRFWQPCKELIHTAVSNKMLSSLDNCTRLVFLYEVKTYFGVSVRLNIGLSGQMPDLDEPDLAWPCLYLKAYLVYQIPKNGRCAQVSV